jgi:hypothetical protein
MAWPISGMCDSGVDLGKQNHVDKFGRIIMFHNDLRKRKPPNEQSEIVAGFIMRFPTILKFGPLFCVLSAGCVGAARSGRPGAADGRVKVQLNADEADAVLVILAKCREGQPVEEKDWRRLFATEPYIRLKRREAELHRDFTDGDFRRYVLSSELANRAAELQSTLDSWKKTDLEAAGRRVLQYLPPNAVIHPKVFPVIKPQTNSFVFEVTTDPAIFLYLDPRVTQQKFENTVAHEMHHIGYASIASTGEEILKDLHPSVRAAVEWMGAFGEGFAMLAAAGGPDVHPHAVSPLEERVRWDRDMANFDRDLKKLEGFFLDIVGGKLKSKEEIEKAGFAFFGEQGPWYTVGYKMAVTIERQFGRARLLDCMVDLRRLLPTYNLAAASGNHAGGDQIAVWSTELLKAIEARPDSGHLTPPPRRRDEEKLLSSGP